MASKRSNLVSVLKLRIAVPGSSLLLVLFLLALLSGYTYSQEPDDSAPPPLKLLSKSERTELNAKTEPKERTALTLQFMESRLKSAEKYHSNENYALMYAELGGFHALMDGNLNFLIGSESSEGKKLNNLKRYEIGLRGFVPRLEGLRNDLPYAFEPYLKVLIKAIDDAREKAMSSFFSNGVVSDH